MRYLVTILLFISAGASAQSGFRADLHVMMVMADTTICEYGRVKWEFGSEIICFELDCTRCFIASGQLAPPHSVLAFDEVGQLHQVRYETNRDGFIIWITNLEKGGFPHFVMSTSNICNNDNP